MIAAALGALLTLVAFVVVGSEHERLNHDRVHELHGCAFFREVRIDRDIEILARDFEEHIRALNSLEGALRNVSGFLGGVSGDKRVFVSSDQVFYLRNRNDCQNESEERQHSGKYSGPTISPDSKYLVILYLGACAAAGLVIGCLAIFYLESGARR